MRGGVVDEEPPEGTSKKLYTKRIGPPLRASMAVAVISLALSGSPCCENMNFLLDAATVVACCGNMA